MKSSLVVVRQILKEELNTLRGILYDPITFGPLDVKISNSIKHRIKALQLHRYRIVSSVHIGNRCNQSMEIVSKCLWDCAIDSYERFVYEEGGLYAAAVVFLVYQD